MENKVGYSRRNAFVPVPTIPSFDDFNESLWDWCEKDAQRPHYKKKLLIEELWEDDKASLLHLPEYPFSVFCYAALTVNKNSFLTIEANYLIIAVDLILYLLSKNKNPLLKILYFTLLIFQYVIYTVS